MSDDAGQTVRSAVTVAYSDGTDVATTSPTQAADAAGIAEQPEVLIGFLPSAPAWLSDSSVRGRAVMAGYAVNSAISDGRMRYVPVRLSAIPRFVADVVRPDVAVISGVRRGDHFAYAENVGWGPALARHARHVIVETWEGSVDLGGPVIEADVRHWARIVAPSPLASTFRPPVPTFRPPDAIDHAIAARVVSILPAQATIQLGPGGVPDAIVMALDRPVQVWSGVVTDSVGGLLDRGLLVGEVTAAYTWGGAPLRDLASTGRLRLVSVEETHDITRLSSIEHFVGLNTALQLGLDGSVNVERINRRVVAGIGGHSDFCAGASRSPGGVSIVSLRSTTKSGASTIVPTLETVSTPHSDVEVVVTEHGIADLRGLDDDQRAEQIIAVAAPEHRAMLRDAVQRA